MNTNKYREWIANKSYTYDAFREGYQPMRWGVLREDLKEKWRLEADSLVNWWVNGENEAQSGRERIGKQLPGKAHSAI